MDPGEVPGDRQPAVLAAVGLGANLGDARATVLAARDSLAALAHTRLHAFSSLYRSAPVDASGPDFINAVAVLETRLSPHEMLAQLQRIESDHGRERPRRNAPRTLDLDLLLYGDQRIDSTGLTVPHPRLHERAFVLLPLAEAWPGASIPGLGELGPWCVRAAGQAITRIEP